VTFGVCDVNFQQWSVLNSATCQKITIVFNRPCIRINDKLTINWLKKTDIKFTNHYNVNELNVFFFITKTELKLKLVTKN